MKRSRLLSALVAALALLLLLASCAPTTDDPTGSTTSSSPTADTTTAQPSTDIVVARPGETCEFRFVYDPTNSELVAAYKKLNSAFQDTLGITLTPSDEYYGDVYDYEIVFASRRREECVALTETLSSGEYAIKVVQGEGTTRIVIACQGALARDCAIQRFIDEFVKEDGVIIPADTYIMGNRTNSIITSSINKLRDPCVLLEDGVYYAYGTNWLCYRNDSGNLDGKWTLLGVVAQVPSDASTNYWAPEVHKYNGEYYMFTTYKSAKTGHRGCTIMKASSPSGPFVEISNGFVTHADWDSIDGTFYVDDEGQPWMVFVHEWTSTDDGVGRMAAARLSDDLTHFISEPIELFRADSPSWTNNHVTDGCWMYKCSTGELLMLWSNFDSTGAYAVGIARSDNGRIDGNWTHDDTLLYSKSMEGTYDGGHGMVFADTTGQLYLSIHSPNTATGDRSERPVFIPIREQNGTLVWDMD